MQLVEKTFETLEELHEAIMEAYKNPKATVLMVRNQKMENLMRMGKDRTCWDGIVAISCLENKEGVKRFYLPLVPEEIHVYELK